MGSAAEREREKAGEIHGFAYFCILVLIVLLILLNCSIYSKGVMVKVMFVETLK